MSLRNKLEFSYRGMALAEACGKRRDHHQERLAFWQSELEAAREAFKGAAVTFEDYPVTGGVRTQAVIDPGKQRRLDECQGKVTGHRDKAEEYDRWARGFTANADAVFALDPEDIAYFGL
jgi:hypothetical protein